MKYLLPILLAAQYCYTQPLMTDKIEERRWILHSNINLPAAKFHLADKSTSENAKGNLELFSSFGVGMSINYGDAIFLVDLERGKIIKEETKFHNLIGMQLGVLYSSNFNETTLSNDNSFSIYSGVNFLDLQFGAGYELGTPYSNSSEWYFTVAYGVPIYKLTGTGSFIFKKKPKAKPTKDPEDANFANCKSF